MRPLSPGDVHNLEQLRRVKRLATLVLVACFLALIAAKLLELHYPWMAVVAAFAEAATIGGIADWYAVVALFKRPLNLPFPHTAIIPRNHERIATNMGQFIERNFLGRDQVAAKLREVDFAAEIARWLAAPERSGPLAAFMVKQLPRVLDTVDQTALLRFAQTRVTTQLAQTDIAPAAGNILQAFTKDGRHQQLLNELLVAMHRFLEDDETRAIIREKVQKELPVVFNVFRADAAILNRIVGATTQLLGEIRDDPDHPLRDEFDVFLRAYLRKLRRSKAFGTRVEQLKLHLLDRPELADVAENLWSGLQDFVLRDAQSDSSEMVAGLSRLLTDLGTRLQYDPDLSQDINDGLVQLLSEQVHAQRASIAGYVANEVRGWDMAQLVALIEINVGRDLQFIRFNGMIIGGCVGVCLYVIERLFLP